MNLFKNANKVLALVMAFAVLAVSLFTGTIAINANAACSTEPNIVYAVGSTADKTYQWNAADGRFMDIEGKTNVGTGTKDDPFILSTPGHVRYLAQNSTYATTHGKYFAVDPSIDIMCFQYEGTIKNNGGIDALMAMSAEEVKSFFESSISNVVTHQGNTGTEAFGGHFDGNGVRFVGIYTGSWGLFGKVSEDATITNLTISNSYIKSGDYAGGIVGYAQCSTTYEATELSDSNCPGVVSFENCTVYNNYIASTGNNQRVGALMGGSATYIGLKMSNCLVYGNDVVGLKDAANPVDMDCLFGAISSGHNGDTAGYPNGSYSDSIILDCVPYSSVQLNQPFKAAYYRNIYTNMPQTEYTPSGAGGTPDSRVWDNYDITIVSDVKGAAAVASMSKLDWSNTWLADDDGYPALRANHGEITITQTENGHTETCNECGFGGAEVACIPADEVKENVIAAQCGVPANYDSVVCCAVCDKELSREKVTEANIIYWDGNYETLDTTSHTGEKDDPYIIENAEQLNYVAMQMAVADTTGKYFKIADGIDAIVLQSSGAEAIMALDNADDVKAYFDNLDEPLDWMQNYAWKQFNGNFDGNGAAIYGLYATNRDANYPPSLFPNIDGGGDGTGVSGSPTVDNVGITIENVIIRNSCYINTGTNVNNNRMGAIAGHTYGTAGAGYVNGTVNFDTIEVSNCYMSTVLTDKAGAGIVIANGSDEIININNALIYGNNATNTDGTNLPIVAHAENSRKDSSDENFVYNKLTNSIILGTAPYNVNNFQTRMASTDAFENVYTDAASGTVTFNTTKSDGNFYTMTYTDSDIKQISGTTPAVIAAEATGLDWEKVWFAGAEEITLREFHTDITVEDNGDGTHSEACTCGLVGLETYHIPGEVVEENEVAAECGKAGSYDEVTYCTVCNAEASRETKTVDALKHEYDATTSICKLCGDECTHGTEGDAFEWNSNDDGTCDTADTGHMVCSICGFTSPEINNPDFVAKEHTSGEAVVENENAATCNEEGSYDEVVYCTECGEEVSRETKVVAATGKHKYNATTGACEVCGTECTHGTEGDAFEWHSNDNATCDTADTGHMVCSICGFTSPEINNPDFVAGHTAGEAVDENVIASTCTTKGSCQKVVYCTVCGEEISRETVELSLDSDNHAFDDAKDADCNNGCGYTREVYTPGDVNEDETINNKDLALIMQNINGWDVEINTDAADVVRDGKINNKDYALLMQYINKWDVELG